MSFRSKPDRVLKKGINADETRRRREEMSIEIRRNKREESLQKKRSTTGGGITGEIQYDTESLDKRSAAYEQLRQLPSLTEDVMSEDPQRQVAAVTAFRKLLSIERSPPIQEVIACGVIPRFVQFLQYQHNPTLQFEAAWALTNVASGTHEHTRVVIDSGAVDIFVQLLSSPSEEVREQAVWALGNIAGDSPDCRDLVLQKGAMGPLLRLCQYDPNAKVTMLRNATWTLSNFTRGKHQPDFNLVKDALPVLAQIIQTSQDAEVLTDACWALSYLSDDTGSENMKIAAVIDSGVAPQLVRLLQHQSANVKTPALRTVGNIVTGDDKQTAKIIELQALPALKQLLDNPKKGIRKEACWTISNIAAGSPEQIQAVINAGLIEPLVRMLQKEEFDIKKEATWAVSNATAGSDANQIRTLVQHGVIPALCSLFSAPDPNIVPVALEGIENILRVGQSESQAAGLESNPYATAVDACGGLDALEGLQQHANDKIFEKVQSIITTYFGVVDAQQPDMVGQSQLNANMAQYNFAPQQSNQQFRF